MNALKPAKQCIRLFEHYRGVRICLRSQHSGHATICANPHLFFYQDIFLKTLKSTKNIRSALN